MGRHGENIRKRADGRWEARYIQSYNLDGKSVYRYIYGKTYQEVKQKRKEAMVKNHSETKKHTEIIRKKFAELAEEWMITKKPFVKQSTYANYRNLLNNHLLPSLGNDYVSAFSDQYIEQFLQEKKINGRMDGTGGLSNKTVADISSLLKMILQYGKSKGYVCNVNFNFSISTGHLPQIQILQKEERKKLEQLLFQSPIPMHLGILISLYGGLRIGEICALQWKDIDFEERTVHIHKTLIRITNPEKDGLPKTKIVLDKPKTECANRIIPLPDDIFSYLERGKGRDEAYILTGKENYMEPRTCLKKYKMILKQSGIKDYSYHALRHTFATRCVELGFDIKTLSEIMGHSNISITMQRYVHPTLEQKRSQMNRLCADSIHGQKRSQDII